MRTLVRLPPFETLHRDLNPLAPFRQAFDFHGRSVEVLSTDREPLDHLRRIYTYFMHSPDAEAAGRMYVLAPQSQAHELLAARVRRPAIDGYVLFHNRFGWGFEVDPGFLLRYYAAKLLRLLVVELLECEVITLHAASLSQGAVGVLLVGDASSGKTTLTIQLIEHGFVFCADDTSCIRMADGLCLPFPMPFIVRSASSAQAPLPELEGCDPDFVLLGSPSWLVERRSAVGVGHRPTHILFLPREEEEPARRAISPTEAALRLMGNVMFPMAAAPDAYLARHDVLSRLLDLASTTRNVAIEASDVDSVMDCLSHRERG